MVKRGFGDTSYLRLPNKCFHQLFPNWIGIQSTGTCWQFHIRIKQSLAIFPEKKKKLVGLVIQKKGIATKNQRSKKPRHARIHIYCIIDVDTTTVALLLEHVGGTKKRRLDERKWDVE